MSFSPISELFGCFGCLGVMEVHQVTWDKNHHHTAFIRSLSCFTCDSGSVCSHYKVGKGKVTFKVISTEDQQPAQGLESVSNSLALQTNDLVTDAAGGVHMNELFADTCFVPTTSDDVVKFLEAGNSANTSMPLQMNHLVTDVCDLPPTSLDLVTFPEAGDNSSALQVNDLVADSGVPMASLDLDRFLEIGESSGDISLAVQMNDLDTDADDVSQTSYDLATVTEAVDNSLPVHINDLVADTCVVPTTSIDLVKFVEAGDNSTDTSLSLQTNHLVTDTCDVPPTSLDLVTFPEADDNLLALQINEQPGAPADETVSTMSSNLQTVDIHGNNVEPCILYYLSTVNL